MNSFFRPSFSTKMVMWTPNSCWPRKRPWTTPRPPWPPLNLIPNLWKRLTPPLQRRNPQPKNPSPLTEKVSLVLKKSYRKSFAKEKELKLLLGMFLLFVILYIWSWVLSDLYLLGPYTPYFCWKLSRKQADKNGLHVKRFTILRNTILGFLKVCLREYQEKWVMSPMTQKFTSYIFTCEDWTMKLPKNQNLVELGTNWSLTNVVKCAEIPWLFLRFELAVLLVLSAYYLPELKSIFKCQDNHILT